MYGYYSKGIFRKICEINFHTICNSKKLIDFRRIIYSFKTFCGHIHVVSPLHLEISNNLQDNISSNYSSENIIN